MYNAKIGRQSILPNKFILLRKCEDLIWTLRRQAKFVADDIQFFNILFHRK